MPPLYLSFSSKVDRESCSVVDDSAADGPPEPTAEINANDYCTLPTESSPCVALDIDMPEQNVPSVGLYYDEMCLQGGGGLTGCGGGGQQACRICFVNRELFLNDFPNVRVPDW